MVRSKPAMANMSAGTIQNHAGITVLQMMPDGQLITRATIADSTTMNLDNVSAISARGNGNTLDIFVSSSGNWITRLAHNVVHLHA